ncbi:hypothetical protein DFP72DRAFT_159385 [Ephemerocybe angulata]|uniref:Fungal-type protein kinase domain-containing protein n=1 Tax=Ephemerocybe angulata TaxID=980116 RepID=A0A8H6H8Z7_9AGAR|nr:hypothetical protein DFP72DRAFT_159385 [Tulosesus angulatus]
MRPSTSRSRNAPPTRIHWTRSRARAAKASDATVLEAANAPISPLASRRNLVETTGSSAVRNSRPRALGKDSDASTIKLSSEDQHIRQVMADLTQELGENVYCVGEEWMQSLYADSVDDAAITTYLASEASGYQRDGRRWTELPSHPTSKGELSASVCSLIRRIIAGLGEPCGDGVARDVVDSHAANLKYPKYKDLCPGISIRATGPSFGRSEAINEYIDGVGYANLASPIDVNLEQQSNEKYQVAQAAFYSKQIYTEQPNRNFIRSLFVTEKNLRLIHYDRSGLYVSPLVNIHRDPCTFIRLVLGLTSTKEDVLGLDTSIQWTTDPLTGVKIGGTIETIGTNGQTVVYDLKMDRPPFIRRTILGRGTTCWYATHPGTGDEVVIKDAWRSHNKASESVFLAAAQGVEGVVQMVSFQDHCADTEAYRPPGFRHPNIENRTKSRLVMQLYGKSIEHFTSRAQAISALRDAILAHRDLLSKDILHRDVSMQNILLGHFGASPRLRGILIDLDMAIWTTSNISKLRADTGLGTRRFQSIGVLHNLQRELPPRHDHLDDLESFFYVLCHLVLLFESPGRRSKAMNDMFAEWETVESPHTVVVSKSAMLYDYWPTSSWWGEVAETLLKGFQDVLWPIVQRKTRLRGNRKLSLEEKRRQMEEIAEESKNIYDAIVQLFDDALEAIEREDGGAAPSTAIVPPPPPKATPSSLPSKASEARTDLKRQLNQGHPDASPPKRKKTLSEPCVRTIQRRGLDEALPRQGTRRSKRLNGR